VAGELGVTSSQVALAWVRSRSRAVHPIIGARTVEQLADNLGTLDVDLPGEAARRLEDATGFSPTLPSSFIAQTSPWVFGDASRRVDSRP
jgi:aryl-alcohol dehydrogenase-like predicted oxidoreductase